VRWKPKQGRGIALTWDEGGNGNPRFRGNGGKLRSEERKFW